MGDTFFSDALVVDFGCGTTKIGFSGQDVPASVLPSVVGMPSPSLIESGAGAGAASKASPEKSAPVSWWRRRHARGNGERYLANPTDHPLPGVAYKPINDPNTGLITDWDAALAQYEWALTQRLGVRLRSGGGDIPGLGEGSELPDSSAYPVLMAESAYASKADREKWAQILFEEYDVPGVFMSRTGVLALYANARVTGISIDVGAGGCTVTPVQEGYPLLGGLRRSNVGGLALDEELLKAARMRGCAVRPRLPSAAARENAPSLHPSVLHWHSLSIARDARESLCRVFETSFDSAEHAHVPVVTYDLPDGTALSIGPERYGVPELLLDPTPLLSGPGASRYEGAMGIGAAFKSSAEACDIDSRRDLVSNCVLTGGLSASEGLAERLHRVLNEMSPAGTKVRITVGSHLESPPGVAASVAWAETAPQ